MNDSLQRTVITVTIALLALMVVGGALAGWLLGHSIPEWLAVMIGSIGTGAFVTSGFFVLSRAQESALAALAESRANHHQLAMAAVARSPLPLPPEQALQVPEETV